MDRTGLWYGGSATRWHRVSPPQGWFTHAWCGHLRCCAKAGIVPKFPLQEMHLGHEHVQGCRTCLLSLDASCALHGSGCMSLSKHETCCMIHGS